MQPNSAAFSSACLAKPKLAHLRVKTIAVVPALQGNECVDQQSCDKLQE